MPSSVKLSVDHTGGEYGLKTVMPISVHGCSGGDGGDGGDGGAAGGDGHVVWNCKEETYGWRFPWHGNRTRQKRAARLIGQPPSPPASPPASPPDGPVAQMRS